MTTTMKMNVTQFNLRPLDRLDAWLEKQLRALGACRQIDEANVRLVRLPNASPAYEVHVHLVTPGPDMVADSRDHTMRAAIAKVVTQLRGQIASRTGKRLHRLKGFRKGRRGG